MSDLVLTYHPYRSKNSIFNDPYSEKGLFEAEDYEKYIDKKKKLVDSSEKMIGSKFQEYYYEGRYEFPREVLAFWSALLVRSVEDRKYKTEEINTLPEKLNRGSNFSEEDKDNFTRILIQSLKIAMDPKGLSLESIAERQVDKLYEYHQFKSEVNKLWKNVGEKFDEAIIEVTGTPNRYEMKQDVTEKSVMYPLGNQSVDKQFEQVVALTNELIKTITTWKQELKKTAKDFN